MRKKKKKKKIIIIFSVVNPPAPMAAIGILVYLSPSKYALLLRYAVSTFGHIISSLSFTSLILYLYFASAFLLRSTIRPFSFFKDYISLILV
jgi:hypothetical protein